LKSDTITLVHRQKRSTYRVGFADFAIIPNKELRDRYTKEADRFALACQQVWDSSRREPAFTEKLTDG